MPVKILADSMIRIRLFGFLVLFSILLLLNTSCRPLSTSRQISNIYLRQFASSLAPSGGETTTLSPNDGAPLECIREETHEFIDLPVHWQALYIMGVIGLILLGGLVSGTPQI
jgi:hypothetical protein